MNKWAYRSELIWGFIALLVLLCGGIAVLQYSWIGKISRAERERLRGELGEKLELIARSFDQRVSADLSQLAPPSPEIDRVGQERAYVARFEQWAKAKDRLFRRVAVAVPRGDSIELLEWMPGAGRLQSAPWPPEWMGLRNGLLRKLRSDPREPYDPHYSQLIEVPRFAHGPRGGESEWLLAELDLDYLRATVFPDLVNEFAGKNEYSAKVWVSVDPEVMIYDSDGKEDRSSAGAPDQSTTFLSAWRGPDDGAFHGGPTPFPGRWRLALHHRDGSLERMVARARWRNLAISGGVLLLIVLTATLLVGISRQREQLAELQMNFVAGVSHELRTPLTVIRTLAFNLTGDLAKRPEQVEKYGVLIRRESERLGELVEQVLLFARTNAGRPVGERSTLAVKDLIDDALKRNDDNAITMQVQIEEDLPPVVVDSVAVKNALRNLVDNAVRYGANGAGWIGVTAAAVGVGEGRAVEIRVADRGPGIPQDEQARIFDAFFRGRRALRDQIHGTGLGLHLTKAAIEANGGTIRVVSEPGHGAEFIVRLPAEIKDE